MRRWLRWLWKLPLLLLAIAVLPKDSAARGQSSSGSLLTGVRIVARSLEEPLRQLANNAGLEGSVVVNEVRTRGAGVGLNIATGEYEDMIKAGIIDPAKVSRSALQNAASIASLLLTTDLMITDYDEKSEETIHGAVM